MAGWLAACGTTVRQDETDTTIDQGCTGVVLDEDTLSQHDFGSVGGRAYMYLQLTRAGSCDGAADELYYMHWDGMTLTHDPSVSIVDDILLAESTDGG